MTARSLVPFCFALLFAPCIAPTAQEPLRPVTLSVRVEAGGAPLADARVRVEAAAAVTNAVGIARLRVGAGSVLVHITRLGFAPDSVRVLLVPGRDTVVMVALIDVAESLSSVVVLSGRGASRIEDAPLRIEALAGEDVAEKMEMRPADATGFLSEMGGVRIQRTAAASGAAGVRLQGLRPRYTLLLTDGLPLTGASGSGLDLLQLPPADLRQVEVIKGPATALYGPAALGGMINLVSKRPAHERDLLIQQSSQRGTNAYGWYSERFSPRWGLTTLVGAHEQSLRDLNGDGWADMPGFTRVEARPRLFFDGAGGSGLLITLGGTNETRDGGFLPGRLAPDATSYREQYRTSRGDAGVIGHRLFGSTLLQLRTSLSTETQDKRYGAERERTERRSAFGELSATRAVRSHEVLLGVAAQSDRNAVREAPTLEYGWTTASIFAQDVWHIAPRFAVTGSGRVDEHERFGTLVAPRLSALYTLRPGLTARASFASGQSAPTPYIEEAQEVGVRRVTGLDGVRPERARYLSADVTGTTGPFELNITLFNTRILEAVQGEAVGATLQLANAVGPVDARGIEFFAEYSVEDFYATALYSYTDSREPGFGILATREAPYAPRHTGGIDLTYEREESGTWIALEGFYSGAQRTSGDPYTTRSTPYTVVGLLIAQQVGPVRLFTSIENLTDVRQTRNAPLVLPARTSEGRWTTRPWGQLEGRVISLGVRWSAQGKPHGLSAGVP